MARGREQIPIGWRREGPKERYVRPEGAKFEAAIVDVYSGYEAGREVSYLAIMYDDEGYANWRNIRYSGRNLQEVAKTLAEIQAKGYRPA